MAQAPILEMPTTFPENLPLKRREIKDAILTLTKIRPAGGRARSATNPLNSLTGLSAEIRNMIYRYSLGMDNELTPRSQTDLAARPDAFNLLQTCRQIHKEARSLLEQVAVLYVPVTGRTNIGSSIYQINRSKYAPLSPGDFTALQGLTTFWHVHIHLHSAYEVYTGMTVQETVALDRDTCNLYSRLRQILLVYTTASSNVVEGRSHLKRHAIVHFDHYFTLWKKRIEHHLQAYKLWHLINIMARDINTTWEIRYYESTEFDGQSKNGMQFRAETWAEFEVLCKSYNHISLKMEIYGAELPEGEKQYKHTRKKTSSKAIWPSWPEHTPWRCQSHRKVQESSSAS